MQYSALIAAGLVAFSFSPAAAQTGPTGNGFYASAYLGGQYILESDLSNIVGLDDIEWDPGFRLGGAVGYRIGRFRVEGELGYRASDGELNLDDGFFFINGADDDVEISILQGSVNAYYDVIDLLLGPIPFTPYIGAGLGVANAEIESDSFDVDETGGVLLFEGGLAIDVTPNFAVVPAYRFDILGIEVGDDDTILSHSLQLGARLSF